LTEKGRALLNVLEALQTFGMRYFAEEQTNAIQTPSADVT
jgi:DNA-binding HxlR family transcriptional regulator